MTHKIQTLHPNPKKQGVNIDQDKYDTIRSNLLTTLEQNGPIPFMKLANTVALANPDFEGSPMWYCETVKLDLEARGIIRHNRTARPAHVELID